MWPFKKSEPVIKTEFTEELIHDTSHAVIGSSEMFKIQVGLSPSVQQEDRYRVFFKMNSPDGLDLQVFPRQTFMTRERALIVADAWVTALEVTFLQSMNQQAENND